MKRLAALLVLAFAQTALAGDWSMRAGDEPLSGAALEALLGLPLVRFHDGGRSEYGPGDSYAYVYSNEDRAEGRYRVEADGSVCVDFVNGFSRCDLYVRNGGRVLLIDRKGDRYPVRQDDQG
ncbi:MAG: hypothetical protein B7Z02_02135 [Rhodobacterales bacterium 32-67-9]|nr:MAG: hypothetical protein B7Z02_02135 [Rhodobacterales bacterium 32-67-9]